VEDSKEETIANGNARGLALIKVSNHDPNAAMSSLLKIKQNAVARSKCAQHHIDYKHKNARVAVA
jgi:hypothetical protein